MRKLLYTALIISHGHLHAQNKIAWNNTVDIAANTYSNQRPRIVLDGKNNPVVLWGRAGDQSMFVSRWNGSGFTMPVKLNPSWLTIATAYWMGPEIASKGDTVYVVAKRTPEDRDTNRLFVFSSFNGGVSFNAPVQLADIADSISRFPAITIDASGNPLVGYMKFNPSFLNSRWVVVKSSDFGKTFSKDVKASGWGNSAEVCDCCPGAIVSSGNKTAMIYRDNNNDLRDIWTGISDNNGVTFNRGAAVDNNKWTVLSCPASGPDGVIAGDTLYSTFMSRGNGFFRIYLSKTILGSGKLVSNSNLTGSFTGLSQQNYPRIASDGRAVAIVWKQTVNGESQLPIVFTSDLTKGFYNNYDTVDLADVTVSDVALANGKVHVVWQDDKSGTVKYRSGTYTPASGIRDLRRPDRIVVYPNPTSTTLEIESKTDILSVVITDAGGRRVLADERKRLDIRHLTAGTYVITVQTASGKQAFRLLKQ